MKNFDEYTDRIRSKAKNIRKRRRIAWSCTTVFVLALALTLFVPYSDQLPNVDRYHNSPYYKLIPGINKATYQPPAHKNNYEWLMDLFSNKNFDAIMEGMDAIGGMSPMDTPIYGVTTDTATNSGSSQKYEEVTDNQVQGVIEGDLFKRSDKYIYYMRGRELSVYTIDKENSKEIARVSVYSDSWSSDYGFRYYKNAHLYLSADCQTLTVVGEGYSKEFGAFIMVSSLDVSNPYSIRQHEPVVFAGNCISSRMVDEELLLIYNYRVNGEIDFNRPETFVPIYGTLEHMQPIGADDIYCPVEEPAAACYTVIAKLDAKTLQVQDTAALLSYSQQVYVSRDAIYATYGCTKSVADGENIIQTAYTEITGISYSGDTLDVLGTAIVEGSVKDQYSMDEYSGILRVATSTSAITRKEGSDRNNSWVQIVGRVYNCNLYCIDLTTWEVAASVIAFAPDGEEVTSARFNGPMGYVCTAEVVVMTDPVYYFDLSDIHNISYKQTPIIDGFSSSLVNFGDYLLGIGQGDWWKLKLEIYEETADGVASVCVYERECVFPKEYKSYFIDRENALIGIHVADSNSTGNRPYLLLHFDGYEFHELQVILSSKTDSSLSDTRAFIDDGYLYLLTEETDGFVVTKLA